VYVSTWAAVGIGQVALETGVPVMFGVLTPKNEKQARQRSRPGPLNRGKEIARAALEMIDFLRGKKD
jgi:6,7-dimethyl-8-ribityllumazine synthase